MQYTYIESTVNQTAQQWFAHSHTIFEKKVTLLQRAQFDTLNLRFLNTSSHIYIYIHIYINIYIYICTHTHTHTHTHEQY